MIVFLNSTFWINSKKSVLNINILYEIAVLWLSNKKFIL
ncbi:hypothetical protein LEP1GSC074_3570 [Leptospira noguchii str. Hook]|nr:hypothetical protein LEP1GSC074_3570 [Leptospira noguchii str. Hook]